MSAPYAAIDGKRATTAIVTIPYYGAWAADVGLASADNVADKLTLTLGDLSLKGYSRRKATFAGTQTARLAGGLGWKKTLKARAYSHTSGVHSRSIFQDAARECGESIAGYTDRVVGTSWIREQAKASRTLKVLANGRWWIDTKGVTQLGARDTSRIVTPFTIVKWMGGYGRFEIATEALSSWMPGRTFDAPTAKGPHTISSVTISIDNEGKARLLVLTADSDENERLRSEIRALIEDELASILTAGLWEYTIVAGTSKVISARPSDARMPTISDCPLYPGLIGEEVTPKPGSKCLVGFVNLDRGRPVCLHIDGAPLVAAVHAVSFLLGSRPVGALGDFAGPFPLTATGLGG